MIRQRRPIPSVQLGWNWLLAAWLAGSLLFAHGCHGADQDHELFTSALPWLDQE